MLHVESLNDFEVLLGTSLDIFILEVEGEPYHNVIKLQSFLDFDKYGMCMVEPSLCYLDDYLSQTDLYSSIWEYISEFSSFDIPLSIEDDAIRSMIDKCIEHTGKGENVDNFNKIILEPHELYNLRKLSAGVYLMGLVHEKVS